ncbi:MAG: FHA domain-containing protein [Planctomycetota bacterium]
MPSLIVVGKKRTEEYTLTDAVTVIGRDKGVNVELSDFKASRRHALLVQTAAGCFVKDLGSRNGVSLNKTRLATRGQMPLKNGDVISLGSTTLVFKDLVAAPDDEVETPAVQPPVAVAAAPPTAPAPARREVVKPPSVVLRASSGRRPSARGEAEALLMQALERADRERSFYRWLSLGLIAVLVIVLLLLLVVALRSPRAAAPADAEVAATPEPLDAPAPAFALDDARYASRVHGVLAERCAGCHAGVGRAGGLVLVSGSDPQSVRANRVAAARFAVAGFPDQSPLLTQPASPGHAGGVVLRPDDADYAELYAWVTTPAPAPASVEATPPAEPNQAPTLAVAELPAELFAGVPLTLDASGSRDPDGDLLHFRWVLSARPRGSQAELGGGARARVSFTPDVAGEYEATVIVHDGQDHLRQAVPFRVGVELAARGEARRVGFERLTRRELTPTEAERLEGLSREDLARQLLAEEGFFVAWWEAELEHLGLTGPARPEGKPWDTMPQRLQRGASSPIDVLFALAVGSKWSNRYAGREAFVSAVLDRLLAAEVDAETRTAATQLYDGYPASFLGVAGSSSADLVEITLADPRALEGVVRRGLSWIDRRAPSDADVKEALGWTEGKPERVFEALARWASRDW